MSGLSKDLAQIMAKELRRYMPNLVEVVRCRDCEYYTKEERWCRRLGLCGAFNKDDFCSHGERKGAR